MNTAVPMQSAASDQWLLTKLFTLHTEISDKSEREKRERESEREKIQSNVVFVVRNGIGLFVNMSGR